MEKCRMSVSEMLDNYIDIEILQEWEKAGEWKKMEK